MDRRLVLTEVPSGAFAGALLNAGSDGVYFRVEFGKSQLVLNKEIWGKVSNSGFGQWLNGFRSETEHETRMTFDVPCSSQELRAHLSGRNGVNVLQDVFVQSGVCCASYFFDQTYSRFAGLKVVDYRFSLGSFFYLNQNSWNKDQLLRVASDKSKPLNVSLTALLTIVCPEAVLLFLPALNLSEKKGQVLTKGEIQACGISPQMIARFFSQFAEVYRSRHFEHCGEDKKTILYETLWNIFEVSLDPYLLTAIGLGRKQIFSDPSGRSWTAKQRELYQNALALLPELAESVEGLVSWASISDVTGAKKEETLSALQLA